MKSGCNNTLLSGYVGHYPHCTGLYTPDCRQGLRGNTVVTVEPKHRGMVDYHGVHHDFILQFGLANVVKA